MKPNHGKTLPLNNCVMKLNNIFAVERLGNAIGISFQPIAPAPAVFRSITIAPKRALAPSTGSIQPSEGRAPLLISVIILGYRPLALILGENFHQKNMKRGYTPRHDRVIM